MQSLFSSQANVPHKTWMHIEMGKKVRNLHDERVCIKPRHRMKQICCSKRTGRHCSLYCQNGEHMVNTLHINECINYNNASYIISLLKRNYSSKQRIKQAPSYYRNVIICINVIFIVYTRVSQRYNCSQVFKN